jgi:nitroimidazol reductase NimA-like FMN-containing flavoprotein (pyridoxamine 5'-phosphate oxidase superfamily)
MPDAASVDLPLDETTRVRREAHRQVRDRRVLHAVLDEAIVAHVAVVRDGLPLVLPFACARDGESLLLHGSTGSGLMRLAVGEPVCVAVTHVDGLVFARTTFDSSMNYRAAVVHGTAVALSGADKERALVVLSEHLFPGRGAEVRPSTARELAATLVLRVPLTQASVKVSDGPPSSEDEPDSVWTGVLPLAVVAGEPVPTEDVPAGVPVPMSVRRAARRAGVTPAGGG